MNTNFEHTFVFERLQMFEIMHFEYTLGYEGTTQDNIQVVKLYFVIVGMSQI